MRVCLDQWRSSGAIHPPAGTGHRELEQFMTITTIRCTRRLGLASGAAAALLLLASACGTETAVSQAPSSIRGPHGSSTESESPAELEECLVQQAKSRHTGIPCAGPSQSAEASEPAYLARPSPCSAARPGRLTTCTRSVLRGYADPTAGWRS